MLPQEILINIIFSTTTFIAFFYIYKQTHLNIMLLAGAITYFEMLTRIFLIEYNPILGIPGINLLMLPELFILIYMVYYIYKDGFPYIALMIIAMIGAFLSLISIGHIFYGDLGIIFSLILLIWVAYSKKPCNINPWKC